jgi:hypothetical protein
MKDRMLARLPLLLLLMLSLASSALGSPLTLGIWSQFGFSIAGTPATGCDPADPSGPFCLPSSGTPTTFLGVPPWTFNSVGSSLLTVTDAFAAGDRFQIFDFGASIGLTSLPVGSSDCGDDPVPCLAAANISHGQFLLASGPHSLTIIPTLAPTDGGSGYLIVNAATTPVPEPATYVLLSCSLFALVFMRRRQP